MVDPAVTEAVDFAEAEASAVEEGADSEVSSAIFNTM